MPNHISSPIYSVDDIGKRGVPKLSADNSTLVARIRKELTPPKGVLRFVEYDGQDEHYDPMRKIYVFLATTDEICSASDIQILNDGPVNVYQPSEDRLSPRNDAGGNTPYPWPIVARPAIKRIGNYGYSCLIGDRANDVGPPSFSVDDLGKVGVPELRSSQLLMIRRIQKINHTTDLRFSILPVDKSDRKHSTETFVLYRSTLELLCASSYQFDVLNISPSATYFPRVKPFQLYSTAEPNE